MGYVILWHQCLLTHSWRSWFLTSKLLSLLSSSAAITLLTSDSSSCTLLKPQLSEYLISKWLTWASRLGSSWLWTLSYIFHPLFDFSTSSLTSLSCLTQPVLFIFRLPCEHCSLAVSLSLFLVGEASALFKHNPWSYSKTRADWLPLRERVCGVCCSSSQLPQPVFCLDNIPSDDDGTQPVPPLCGWRWRVPRSWKYYDANSVSMPPLAPNHASPLSMGTKS